jgi:hypothetical protein
VPASVVREGNDLVVFFNGSRREGYSPGFSVGRVHYHLD